MTSVLETEMTDVISLVRNREFEAGQLVLGAFWRFDEGEVGIRCFGTSNGTGRGVAVFDEDEFHDRLGEQLEPNAHPSDAQLGMGLRFLYENARALGAKQISVKPDYQQRVR